MPGNGDVMDQISLSRFEQVAKSHGVNPDDEGAVDRFLDQILKAPLSEQAKILDELTSIEEVGLPRRSSPDEPLGTPMPASDPSAVGELQTAIREIARAKSQGLNVSVTARAPIPDEVLVLQRDQVRVRFASLQKLIDRDFESGPEPTTAEFNAFLLENPDVQVRFNQFRNDVKAGVFEVGLESYGLLHRTIGKLLKE